MMNGMEIIDEVRGAKECFQLLQWQRSENCCTTYLVHDMAVYVLNGDPNLGRITWN